MFYTWRKGDIDAIVNNLSKTQEQVKRALEINKAHILATASRYFQSTRSKIATVINNGCTKALKEMTEKEEERAITIRSKSCIFVTIQHTLFF